jgi:hypothetical protein
MVHFGSVFLLTAANLPFLWPSHSPYIMAPRSPNDRLEFHPSGHLLLDRGDLSKGRTYEERKPLSGRRPGSLSPPPLPAIILCVNVSNERMDPFGCVIGACQP